MKTIKKYILMLKTLFSNNLKLGKIYKNNIFQT